MGKQEGKKLTKKAELRKEKEPPQAPPKGGDVRGYGGIWVLTKPRE